MEKRARERATRMSRKERGSVGRDPRRLQEKQGVQRRERCRRSSSIATGRRMQTNRERCSRAAVAAGAVFTSPGFYHLRTGSRHLFVTGTRRLRLYQMLRGVDASSPPAYPTTVLPGLAGLSGCEEANHLGVQGGVAQKKGLARITGVPKDTAFPSEDTTSSLPPKSQPRGPDKSAAPP